MSQRVLIVDDSAVARLTVARRVRAAGFDVVEHDSCASASGVDARALACALLDFDLGDGFGVDVAARLRSETNALPIAFFTSSKEPSVVAKTAPFGPVFAKPDELEDAVAWVSAAAKR